MEHISKLNDEMPVKLMKAIFSNILMFHFATLDNKGG